LCLSFLFVRQHWRTLGLGSGFAKAVSVLSAEDFSPFSRVVLTKSCVNTGRQVRLQLHGACFLEFQWTNNKTFGRRANWHRFLRSVCRLSVKQVGLYEKYCQFIILFTKYNHLHPTSNFGDRPLPPKFSGFANRPTGWGNSESTVTVLPSTAVFFHGTYRGAQSVVPPNTKLKSWWYGPCCLN